MKINSNSESWLPVVGWEDLYHVSNLGHVKSLDRIDAIGRKIKGRTLKPLKKPNGYQHVHLCRDSDVHKAYVHRLVLAAFVGPAPDGCECCHDSGARSDNRLQNLRWGTRKDNAADTLRHGTRMLGVHNHQAQLCELDVWLIRELAETATHRKIASWFELSRTHVSDIVGRRKWVHV